MPKIMGRGSRAGKSDGRFVAVKSRGGLFGRKPRWHRHRWVWTCVGTWGNDDRQECSKCGKTNRSL